jgi:hypothetical protein
MFEARLAKVSEKILGKVRPLLEPGERAEHAVLGAASVLPQIALAIYLVAVVAFVPTATKSHGGGWVILLAAIGGGLLGLTVRRVALVATDRRILLVQLPKFGSEPKKALFEVPRPEATVAAGSAGVFFGALRVTLAARHGQSERLYVAKMRRPLLSEISGPARTPAPSSAPPRPD